MPCDHDKLVCLGRGVDVLVWLYDSPDTFDTMREDGYFPLFMDTDDMIVGRTVGGRQYKAQVTEAGRTIKAVLV